MEVKHKSINKSILLAKMVEPVKQYDVDNQSF